jgi:hypothetical protein
MSREAHIALHLQVIREAQQTLKLGSDLRLSVIHRSIEGIRRAKESNYNQHAYEGQ